MAGKLRNAWRSRDCRTGDGTVYANHQNFCCCSGFQLSQEAPSVNGPPVRSDRRPAGLLAEMDDTADALAFMHQLEGFIDIIQAHGVGDEIIELELALQVALDNTG